MKPAEAADAMGDDELRCPVAVIKCRAALEGWGEGERRDE